MKGGEVIPSEQFFGCGETGFRVPESSGRRPRISERILSLFGDHANDVTMIAAANEGFRRRLVELSSGQFHLLGFCLAWRDQVGQGEPSLDRLGQMLVHQKPRAVILAVAGSCPDGLPGCLGKLPGRFIPDPDYLLLYRLLQEPRAARLLWHVDRIGSGLLQLLDGLDPVLRHRPFVEFARTPKALAAIDYLVGSVMSFCPEVGRADIVGSLASVSSPRSLEGWFTRWLERAPFPTPPWPGTVSLGPISSSAELIVAARTFENCLRDRLAYVVAGYAYFYVWQESPRAVAELVRDPFAGWLVGTITGVANKTVPAGIVSQIMASFAEAGFAGRPDFLGCPRHVNPSCWAGFPYLAPN